MKQFFATFLIALSVASCGTSVKQIGKVNMLSIRNVDPNLKYKLLSSYMGGSNSELKRAKATTIEDAMAYTVKKVPGGEFLMNVKLYQVKRKYYAVEGDVWGAQEASGASFRGFKVADKIIWKKGNKFKNGTIAAFKDDKVCLIKLDGDDKILEAEFTALSKTQ